MAGRDSLRINSYSELACLVAIGGTSQAGAPSTSGRRSRRHVVEFSKSTLPKNNLGPHRFISTRVSSGSALDVIGLNSHRARSASTPAYGCDCSSAYREHCTAPYLRSGTSSACECTCAYGRTEVAQRSQGLVLERTSSAEPFALHVIRRVAYRPRPR